MIAGLERLKLLLVAVAGIFLLGCEHRTVVYTSAAPVTRTTYVRGPAQTTRTVYVKESTNYPTSLPGAPIRLSEPGEVSDGAASSR